MTCYYALSPGVHNSRAKKLNEINWFVKHSDHFYDSDVQILLLSIKTVMVVSCISFVFKPISRSLILPSPSPFHHQAPPDKVKVGHVARTNTTRRHY